MKKSADCKSYDLYKTDVCADSALKSVHYLDIILMLIFLSFSMSSIFIIVLTGLFRTINYVTGYSNF